MRVMFVAVAAGCVFETKSESDSGSPPTLLLPTEPAPAWTADLSGDCPGGFPVGAASWSSAEVSGEGDTGYSSYDTLRLEQDEWSVGGAEELVGVADARRVTWSHQTRSGIGGNYDDATWAVECRDGGLWGLALLSARSSTSDDMLSDRWEGTVVFQEPVLLLQPQGSWDTSWSGADVQTTDSNGLEPEASGRVTFGESEALVGVRGEEVSTRYLRMEIEGDDTANLLGLFWPRQLWLDGAGGLVQVAHRDDVLAQP